MRHASEQFEINFLCKPPERSIADRRHRLEERQRLQVMSDDAEHMVANVETVDGLHVESIEYAGCGRDPCLLVIDRSNPPVDERGRRRLAEVVTERAEHHGNLPGVGQIVDTSASLVHDHQCVNPHVTFGMPVRFLRTSDQRLDLGKELFEDTKLQRQCQADGGAPGQEQQLLDFAPNPLRRQIVEANLLAQLLRRGLERELEPRGKLNGPQYPQAVLGKRSRVDGLQQSTPDVVLAVKRVDVLVGRVDPRRWR